MISIVVPVLNEAQTLPQLYERVCTVMEQELLPFELILVDDGSSDGSTQVILDLCREDQRVKAIELSRNFGHQMALAAGLDYSRGEAVVTMDADLQHPPELIPQLVRKWKAGYDVVYTSRRSTAGTGLFKDSSSRFFYRLISRLSEVEIPAGAADFRILDRKVVQVFQAMDERALFLRGLVSWVGFQQAEIPFDAAARQSAGSRYSLFKMLRFAVDGITSFSSIPLYLSAILGMVASLLGFIYAAYAVYARLFTNQTVEGWTSVIIALLVLGGVQLMALGVHGVYLGRMYNEVKKRPRYLVRRAFGFDQTE
ncbi:MAG: glycosyltransferase family 2 protein [Acidobacteriota bacterium]